MAPAVQTENTKLDWFDGYITSLYTHWPLSVISEHMLGIKLMNIYSEIALRWMPQNNFDVS